MKYDQMFMDYAIRTSQESKCPRKKVGCIVVTQSGMIAPGLNGMASGGPNEWEYSEIGNEEVVHAEMQALGKMLEQGVSAKNSCVYLTLSPCIHCAKLLVRAKVNRVVYLEEYRKADGLEYLQKYKINVEKFMEKTNGYEGYINITRV